MRIILFVYILFISVAGLSQQKYKADSVPGFEKNIGYGVANILDVAFNSGVYRPQVYVDISGLTSGGFYYRIGLSTGYGTSVNGNVRQHDFIPSTVTVGVEKIATRKNFFFVYGVDLFYSMSLRKSRLSPFQVDDYGVGVAPYFSAGVSLRENLALFSQYEIGVGMYRDFVGVGTIAAQTLRPRINFVRNLSFGVRHFF